MQLIAAPSRQFRTWSLWLGIIAGLIALTGVFVESLSEAKFVDTKTALLISACLSFAGVIAKFVKQQIELTTNEKADIIESAALAPVKPGQQDIEVMTRAQPPIERR